MTSSNRQCISADHVRLLVCLHTNPMTGAVHKVFTKSRCFNNAPRCGINVLTRCTNDPCGYSGCLRSKQHFICCSDICRRLARIDTSSDVTAIAIHRSTKIAQHNFVLRNHTRPCVVVWACSIFASGHNCKVDDIMTFSQQSSRDICRHLSFGTTNERYQTRMQLCRNAICCGTSSHQCCDLTCILAHAQCTNHINRANKRCPRH